MPEADETLTGAHDLALAALHEITPPSTVGPAAGYLVEDDGSVSLRFENRLPGYPGWYWTVTVARVEDSDPTVLEVELLPNEGALLAPEWVPWAERMAEYRAHQIELAEQAAAASMDDSDEDDSDDDDSDLDDADLDDSDEDDEDDEDEDPSESRVLHAGDLDGVDIDELDDSVVDEDDESEDDESEDDESEDDESEDDEFEDDEESDGASKTTLHFESDDDDPEADEEE